MGCIHSRPGEDDVVRRFEARKRFLKQAVLHRHTFAAAHYSYLLSLRNTGSALRQFAQGEAKDNNHNNNNNNNNNEEATPAQPSDLPQPPPPPPPTTLLMSPAPSLPSHVHRSSSSPPAPSSSAPPAQSDSWSASSSPENSDTPPPPSPPKSAWEIFNPFRPSSPVYHLGDSTHHHRRKGRRAQANGEIRAYGFGGDGRDGTGEAGNDDHSLAKWENSHRDVAASTVRIDGEKDLLDVVKELDEQFLKASSCATSVSKLLETRKGHLMNDGKATNGFPAHMFAAITHWAKNPLSTSDDATGAEAELVMGSHALVLQRLYTWEKKLFNEVKAGEALRTEHQKKAVLLHSQEAKGEDPGVIERTRAAMKRLHSEILVSYQGAQSISAAVKKARDEELYPQLMELAEGLMYMWRTMHECHAYQKQVVLQFKDLDSWVAHDATTDYHHHATVELEKELNNWHDCFCKLVSSHRDYVKALTGWSRLSTMEIHLPDDANKENDHQHFSVNDQDLDPSSSSSSASATKSTLPRTVLLCEEWQKTLDRLPDRVASEAIKSLSVVVHALVVQQTEELKQKRKVESLAKRLEKKVVELHAAEKKQVDGVSRTSQGNSTETEADESVSSESERVTEDGYSVASPRDPLTDRKAAVEVLKKKLDNEKAKHEKFVQDTRVLTMNNMQTGLPGVFEAMTGFAAVCGQAFQALYNEARSSQNHY